MIAAKLLQMMKDFLEGRIPAVEFSFNFPTLLVETYEELKDENPQLCALLNDGDLPDDCAWFEPDKAARAGSSDCLDEPIFKRKVKAVYEQAIRLVGSTA